MGTLVVADVDLVDRTGGEGSSCLLGIAPTQSEHAAMVPAICVQIEKGAAGSLRERIEYDAVPAFAHIDDTLKHDEW
jgi:hypothetical protein